MTIQEEYEDNNAEIRHECEYTKAVYRASSETVSKLQRHLGDAISTFLPYFESAVSRYSCGLAIKRLRERVEAETCRRIDRTSRAILKLKRLLEEDERDGREICFCCDSTSASSAYWHLKIGLNGLLTNLVKIRLGYEENRRRRHGCRGAKQKWELSYLHE